MRLRFFASAIILAATIGLVSCGGSADPSDVGALVSNSGLAVAGNFPNGVFEFGGFAFVLVNEVEQNNTDLNADGDSADDVVFMIDIATGTSTNLGVAGTPGFASNATMVAWGVVESDQGQTDLNGDGDFGDRVLAVFDPTMAVGPTNPSMGMFTVDISSPILGDTNYFASVSREVNEDTNLNSDFDSDGFSDFSDFVVQVLNTNTMTVFNSGLPANPMDRAFLLRHGVLTVAIAEAEHILAVPPMMMGDPPTFEAVDFNFDGDSQDILLYYADLDTNPAAMTPVGPASPRAVDSGAFGIYGTAAAPVIVYSIDEGSIGMFSNLNGSGISNDVDNADDVLALFDVNGATETLPAGGLAIQSLRVPGSETRILVSAVENHNGVAGLDFNADGDTDDFVPFWIDLANPSVVNNTGIAHDDGGATNGPFVCGNHGIFFASEAAHGPNGTNFNQARSADQDTSDFVAHFVTMLPGNQQVENLGYAGDQMICDFERGDYVIMITSETDNGMTDLSGDNDTADEVVFYFPVVNDVVNPAGIFIPCGEGNIVVQSCPTAMRFIAFTREGSDQRFGDLNQDGDLDDHVVHSTLVGKPGGAVVGASILGTVDSSIADDQFPMLLGTTGVAFPTAEANLATGVNLNGSSGDGDTFDSILFFASLTCP